MTASRWTLVCGIFLACVHAEPTQAQRSKARERTKAAERTGTLVVEGPPPGAEVIVDAEVVGKTPLSPTQLAPGRHAVRISLPGYTEFTDVVLIRRGRETVVTAELLPVSMALRIVSEPEKARVFLDGKFAGETPLDLDLLEGDHSLRIHLSRYRDVIRQLTAIAGESDELVVKLEAIPVENPTPIVTATPTRWYEKPGPWIGIGAGTVAVTVAVVLAVLLPKKDSSPVDGFCKAGCVRLQPGP